MHIEIHKLKVVRHSSILTPSHILQARSAMLHDPSALSPPAPAPVFVKDMSRRPAIVKPAGNVDELSCAARGANITTTWTKVGKIKGSNSLIPGPMWANCAGGVVNPTTSWTKVGKLHRRNC